MDHKTIRLNGGLLVNVTMADNSIVEIKVRQLPTGEWDKAIGLFTNERALVALICGQPPEWINTVAPESYGELYKVAREVNELGFFDFASRQLKAGQEEIERLVKLGVPLEKIIEAGKRSISLAGSRAA